MQGLRERTAGGGARETGRGQERSARQNGSAHAMPPSPIPAPSAWAERHGILLLLLLYTVQGLPMGLIFGSIPFLLKERASYLDLAVFSLCSMPYALKLLIAPLVDGGRAPLAGLGRRRGWIVPPLTLAGGVLVLLAGRIGQWVDKGFVRWLTPVCFCVIALTAVQDVAVDGWSLELLSPTNVAYASTSQSLGTSIGFLASFTVFLALNDPAFCARHVWPWLAPEATGPAVTLAMASRCVGGAFLVAAALVALAGAGKEGVAEDEIRESRGFDLRRTGSLVDQEAHLRIAKENIGSENVVAAYRTLGRILRLRPVQSLAIALLMAKVGFSAYDSATSLKLIDFGFPKESIASITLIQAPIRLIGTLIAGRWAAQGSPETPYLIGYALRFLFSLSGPALVHTFSGMGGVVTNRFYATVVAVTVAYGIAADCLMFVSIGAFFLRITSGSTAVGGSYLTLLYAAQNMGGMWHTSITLALVERLTFRKECVLSDTVTQCPVSIDGYFVLSAAFVPVAILVGLHLQRTMRRLGKLPLAAWKPVPA